MATEKSKKTIYTKMLKGYPDVLNINQMCEILGGISTKTGYKMLHENVIESIRIGRQFRIAKVTLIDFIVKNNQ